MDKKELNYIPDVDKMYTYLNAFLKGACMMESLKALNYARQKHRGQYRKNGVAYIAHPLSMACQAAALGIRDDNVMSTILLHDVCEDCGIDVETLPFNDVIKHAVKHMTITKFDTDKSKIETKRRYFYELLDSKEALITKALDRYDNLSDMPFTFESDAIAKNIAETEVLLLPVLKEAKEKWTELSDILFSLRTHLRRLNNVLKLQYYEQYQKWYKTYTE